ncbi:MAG TPA: ABC transporter ATP-binding protein [Steroidobacteraceae bacterium]|nr:ABC transporter ATP-binding protein [Steroidobacteraceae bacterium]
MSQPLINLTGVSKLYALPSGDCVALRDVTLQIRAGECVAVVGKSGSGKTTLINVLTGIDAPTSGEVQVAGAAIHPLSQEKLAIWRGRNVGVVFQFFQLLPTLTILENVMLPMDFCQYLSGSERPVRARELLNRVGIGEQADKYPAELSGGQQQRAAIARSLANDPPIVVADEPTGNLDSKTSDEVMGFFTSLAQSGKTVLIVTHERDLGRFFTRTITLNDGAVLADSAA